ncbi:uncharacterized protein DNG_04914 [Cephalotrichum gorgonifer]|uniref:Uncharacterized protein n=1 Tax=Cephalotrichum gorgonifer TaxID=2041049 RepID=A0AAE8MWY3_9PEZI|nr:uncharacterized protein DNG_04914 [Cephalotrichum gorgonifer]
MPSHTHPKDITLAKIQLSAVQVTGHAKAALTLNTPPTCGAHGASTKAILKANDIASHAKTLRVNNERIHQHCVEAEAETKSAYRATHSTGGGHVVESWTPTALDDVLARGEEAMADAHRHFEKAMEYYDGMLTSRSRA